MWFGLALVSASQTALLQGLRRIGDLARVTIIGAFLGTLVGILLVWQLGLAGVVWLLLVVPVASALFAALLVARLPRPEVASTPLSNLWPEWRALFSLGFAVMAATLLTGVTQLAIRARVTETLGIDATGHFEAAWSISMNYIGFVLAAMATDYYPRLTAAIGDRDTANRLVNEQAEVALLLAAPVLVGIVSFAPLVTSLLYSSEFAPTVEVLRFQVIGDVMKVAAWPMGFILLARGANRHYFITELAWNAAYLAGVFALLPIIGLSATGVAFVLAYGIYLLLIARVSHDLTGFELRRTTLVRTLMTLGCTAALAALSYAEPTLSTILGLLATLTVSVLSLRALLALMRSGGEVGRLGRLLARFLKGRG